MKVVFPVRGLTAVFLLLWGWRQLSWRARMQSAGFMRRSGAGSGGCCRRRRSRHLSFSIHFGLCGASGVGKWGRAAFRGGKAAFYLVFVTIYAFGCLAVCRKPGFLAALIPVLSLRASCSARSFDASSLFAGSRGCGKAAAAVVVSGAAFSVPKVFTREQLLLTTFLDNFDKKIAIFSFNYYNKKRHPVSSINLPDVFMRENQERSEHNGKPES